MPQSLSVNENVQQLLLRDNLLWVFVSGSLQGNIVRPYPLYFLVSAGNINIRPQLHHITTLLDIYDYLFVNMFLLDVQQQSTFDRPTQKGNQLQLIISKITFSKNLDIISTWSVRLDFQMLVIYYPILRLGLRQ